MIWHVILGMLTDGKPRHGYDLVVEYNTRSGTTASSGYFYRELARLTARGLVVTGVAQPNEDARRIPYQITSRGRAEFSRWLVRPGDDDTDFIGWLLFVEQVAVDVRDRILKQREDVLWVRNKVLARAREKALDEATSPSDPLPALVSRQMKQVSAELEFLEEFRRLLAEHPPHKPVPQPAPVAAPAVPSRLRRKDRG